MQYMSSIESLSVTESWRSQPPFPRTLAPIRDVSQELEDHHHSPNNDYTYGNFGNIIPKTTDTTRGGPSQIHSMHYSEATISTLGTTFFDQSLANTASLAGTSFIGTAQSSDGVSLRSTASIQGYGSQQQTDIVNFASMVNSSSNYGAVPISDPIDEVIMKTLLNWTITTTTNQRRNQQQCMKNPSRKMPVATK